MNKESNLSKEEIKRYSRHLTLPNIGLEGQEKLKASSVLLIGAGGLGSPAALYLAAAGVGTLGIVDADHVDESNLQRQILHASSRLGVNKSISAKAQLADINPHISVNSYEYFIDEHNAIELIKPYDLVVDGSDNFTTRYLVNDACVFAQKPLIYGSIYRFEGQASVWDASQGPCYRCLYPEMPSADAIPNCAEAGVLGILPGVIGSIQATEAIKVLLGIGKSLLGRLLLYDALAMNVREIKINKDPNCPLCGSSPRITELKSETLACPSPRPEKNSMQAINVYQLQEKIYAGETVNLLDVRENFELALCTLEPMTHIPLGQLSKRFTELDATKDWIVYCHHGMRSAHACQFLAQNGITKVTNLSGGIHDWAEKININMPKY